MPPSFSIVIPTYGRPDRLRACLHSLAELDYDPGRYEVIVVDDGSDPFDPVEEAIRGAATRVRTTLVRQGHAGPAAARNRGSRSAAFEVLAFTDDDCCPDPGWLGALAAAWNNRRDRVVGGRTINALDDNVYSEATQALVGYLYEHGRAKGEPFFASNNLALSRSLFDGLGGFAEDFRLAAGEDRDFCDRCVREGCDMTFAADAVVRHHHALSLRPFLRQHFQYGRGAFVFHEARLGRREGGARFEPLGFYAGLVFYSIRRSSGIKARLHVASLLAAAQVANAAGYVVERRRRRTGR